MRPAPGLYPAEQPRPSSSFAEPTVWKALRTGLPPNWFAWHALRLRNGAAGHTELDFVLAHPERGVLVLEVKGGRMEVRDGHWYQNGKLLKEPPLAQAHRGRNALLRRFKELRVEAPSIGQAACFPDHEFDNQPTADDLRGIVLGPSHLRWLAQSLPPVVERAVPPPRRTDDAWLERLHAMWCERWVPSLSLGGRAEEQARRRLRLDEDQLAAFEGLMDNPRVLVSGGAGSGKTILAAEAARRLAGEGRSVLFLCFTAPLQRWLAERLREAGVEVQTVSGLAKRLEQEVGPAPGDPDLGGADGWGALFRHVAPHATQRWDAIVLDEAQDLQAEAWDLVERLAMDRILWAFHDAAQGFWPERHPRASLFGTTYRLRAQQRSPAGLLALAHRALGLPHDEAAIAAARTEGLIRTIACEGDTTDAIGAEVSRLLTDGLKPSDVGIVSLRGKHLRDVAGQELLRFGLHAAVRADGPDAQARLVADSFLRWKGLERPAVIVTDLPEGELFQLPIRLNIALTRATVAVTMVGSSAALQKLDLTEGRHGKVR